MDRIEFRLNHFEYGADRYKDGYYASPVVDIFINDMELSSYTQDFY